MQPPTEGRPDPSGEEEAGRVRRFWLRHRTLFWTLHSFWALATGVVVILLARERYGFVPVVVLFLLLTWASTLFFGRRVPTQAEGEAPGVPGFGEEAVSYATRTMYQETLFFLLPFYAYSTVVRSPNVLFLGGLAVLALLSCVDLVFDRWLRTSAVARLTYFAVVAFAAVNLLLPILLPLRPLDATRLAALVAVVTATPLALRGGARTMRVRLQLAGAVVLLLAIALGWPRLVPPVPVRLDSAVFTTELDRATLQPADSLTSGTPAAPLDGSLYVLFHVFSPTVVPASVTMHWKLDDEVVRVSREIEILAHEDGFRVWDGWRPTTGVIAPGRYQVELRAAGQRTFGYASLRVDGP